MYHMDIQLKRGLLDVCVLAAIKSEDSYGYQIIKDRFSPTAQIRSGLRSPAVRPSDDTAPLRISLFGCNGNGIARRIVRRDGQRVSADGKADARSACREHIVGKHAVCVGQRSSIGFAVPFKLDGPGIADMHPKSHTLLGCISKLWCTSFCGDIFCVKHSEFGNRGSVRSIQW